MVFAVGYLLLTNNYLLYTIHMNDLSKQQLILLALLVSFVTSLATGIVTVSLLDQAPTSVTRTVSQVIEKTIQQAMPQDAAAVRVITIADQSALAVTNAEASLVTFQSRDGKSYGGNGLVVSDKGVILADKSTIAGLGDYSAVFPNGKTVPVTIVQSQIDGDIIFLAPDASVNAHVAASSTTFADPATLGQSVLAITGTSTKSLAAGFITQTATTYHTTITNEKVVPGAFLFDLYGNSLGVYTNSLRNESDVQFYPLSQLKSAIPVIK